MKKINVLVLEDDTLISMQIEDALIRMDHTVVDTIRCGKDALDVVAKYDIDLIISDINIEGDLDGISVSQIIHEQYNIPIIFITAYKDVETLQRASEVEFVGYILKPFREDELEALVNIAIIKYNLPQNKPLVKIDKNYSYCLDKNKLMYEDIDIELTKSEIKFIRLLIQNKGEVVPYEIIELTLWQDKLVTTQTRRQLIHRMKKKIPAFPLVLQKAVGYKLNV